MAALDKLIDLLEKLKQENPEFHDKAGKALDVLVDEDVEDKFDINEEVEFDDSYVEMEDHEYNKIAEFRNNTTKLILEIGVLLQNFENEGLSFTSNSIDLTNLDFLHDERAYQIILQRIKAF